MICRYCAHFASTELAVVIIKTSGTGLPHSEEGALTAARGCSRGDEQAALLECPQGSQFVRIFLYFMLFRAQRKQFEMSISIISS